MAYQIFNGQISSFQLLAGQAPGSNIAVSGFLDFPQRLGKAYHSWPDEHGVEPWLHASLQHYEGRDIDFYAIAKVVDPWDEWLAAFYDEVKAQEQANGLTSLVTPWTSHEVYLRGTLEIDRLYAGWARVKIPFREPVADLSGTIPIEPEGNNFVGLDRIKWSTLGIVPLELVGKHNLAGLKEMSFSVYGREGYEITKHQPNTRTFRGLLNYADMPGLVAGCQALYAILSQAKLIRLKMAADTPSREVFNTEGFVVGNIVVENSRVTALLEMTVIEDGIVEDVLGWILAAGEWNDEGSWDDASNWIDTI